MKEYKKFKKLLEYFVAHLEWCVNEDKKHVGYINYIKPLIDAGVFKKSGQGYNRHRIQDQIKDWASYANGVIHISIDATHNYKSRGCYLHWEVMAMNVNAIWDNNKIVELKIVRNSCDDDAEDVVTCSIQDLGLFDNNPPNKRLKEFFDQFEELIISEKMNEHEKFKKLLEYFVAHLEWGANGDKKHVGYINYIKPLIDAGVFKKSGQGYTGDKIQDQIKDWASYANGVIHISIDATHNYKSRGCYLHWNAKDMNVNPIWDNNKIVELKIVKNSCDDDAEDVVTCSIQDLGLFDNNSSNKILKEFFDQFEELITSEDHT